MAWQDILGGLAGGLSQGLGQVQQNVEARRRSSREERETLLAQLAAAQRAEELARQQALTPINSLEEGVEFDPSDPTYAPGVKIAGAGAFVKGPSGKLMKKPKAQNVMADQQLADYEAGAAGRAGEREAALRKQRMQQSAFALFEKKYGPNWVEGIRDMDAKDRQVAGTMLMGDKDAFLRPEETPSVIASKISADGYIKSAAMRGGGEGAMTDDMRQLIVAFDNHISKGGPGYQRFRTVHAGDREAAFREYLQQNAKVLGASGAPNVSATTPATPARGFRNLGPE